MKLMAARDAMACCAVAMESLTPEDQARPDVRAIYSAAAQIETSWAVGTASRTQLDDRIAVPDWLTTYNADAPPAADGVAVRISMFRNLLKRRGVRLHDSVIRELAELAAVSGGPDQNGGDDDARN